MDHFPLIDQYTMIATQNRSTTAQLDYGRPWTQRDTLLFGAELSRLRGLSSPVQANKQGRCEDEKLFFFSVRNNSAFVNKYLHPYL